jgi:PKD repeat protein
MTRRGLKLHVTFSSEESHAMLGYNSPKYSTTNVECNNNNNNNNNVKNGKDVQRKEQPVAIYSSNLKGVLAQVRQLEIKARCVLCHVMSLKL